MKGKLTLFHGDKGGVGKSFVAALYLDAHLQAGGADQLMVVESDTRNPDIARLFQSHLQVKQIDLRHHDGWMELVDLLASNQKQETVVSLPANIGQMVEMEGDYLATTLKALDLGLRIFWPINRLKDSIILLKEFLGSPLGTQAEEITVCMNGFFGRREKFSKWNESQTRKVFLTRKGCREIYLQELHERIVDVAAAPFSLLQGLRYSEKLELQRWLKANQPAVFGGPQ